MLKLHSDISFSSGLVFLSASELAEKIQSRQVTSLDVVQAHLDHIRKHNPALNAIVALDEDSALLQARTADEAMARGDSCGPLHGVPVTVKDNVAALGFKTTHGYVPTADYTPSYDATVVARLRKAGAIVLGKTNLPCLAKDYQTHNLIFGVTNNPWNLSRTPGGSTGGGAAAVAAGLSPLEIGNDLGGSLRIPAHFCGIYGVKPTERLIPRTGIIPGLPKTVRQSLRHLTSMGPLARSVDDLKLCLKILAGPDGIDVDVPPVSLIEPKQKNPKDIRIAWADVFPGVPVAAEIQAALKRLADLLSRTGYSVVKTLPANFDFGQAWQTWGRIGDMEFGSNMPMRPFMRFLMFSVGGISRKDAPLLQVVYPATYKRYATELWKRAKLISIMDRFLDDYDVLLCPVHTTAAFKHIPPNGYFGPYSLYKKGMAVDGQLVNYWTANASYTCTFNLTGHPVAVMPIGQTEDGLPIGVQVVGKRWHDMELLQVVGQLDEIVKAYKRPPGF